MKQKANTSKLMKAKFYCAVLSISLSAGILSAQVSLTATGATTSGTYSSLSNAFAAVNAGTHKGVIKMTITSDYTESTTPTALRESGYTVGAATSSYSSITIVPDGNRVITGNPSNFRAVIELFNTKQVYIDGDDPATSGDRNLTINNVSTNVDNMGIHIGSSNTLTAENCTIKNCIIRCGRPSNTASNGSYAIAVSNTSISNSPILAGNAGIGAQGIIIENNEIYKCLYGIVLNGGTTAGTEFYNLSIRGNNIGATSTSTDWIGVAGIFIRNASNVSSPSTIEGNEIMVGVNTGSGMSLESIGIDVSNGNANLIINRNYIHDIINNIGSTAYNVVGIRIGGTGNTNILMTNNIIRDVISARKTTTIGAGANYGMYITGTIDNLRVRHNTIGLIAPNTSGSTTGYYNACVYFNTASPVLDFVNNILVNNNVSTASAALGIVSTGFNGALSENNCFHTPIGVLSNLAPNLGAWQFLNGKDQSSFVEKPKFVSPTDLHIQSGAVTKLESGARATSPAVSKDIDNDNRPSTGASARDVGADEFGGTLYVKPSVSVVGHTPNTSSCSASPRTVITNGLNPGNALDSVMLEYRFNSGTKTYTRMSYATAGVYTGSIPAASPNNAVVSYRVFCVTSIGDTVTTNYYYYQDNVGASALVPTVTSTPTAACAGSKVVITYSYAPDPTGVNFPPRVDTPSKFSDMGNVTFRSINNTTAISSLVGNLGTAKGTAGAYSNFRDFLTPTVVIGRSYPISMTSISPSTTKDYFAAFIDFNGDGDFMDADETVFNTLVVPTSGSRTEVGQIFVSASARPGKTTMRCMVSNTPILNAYTTLPTGEVEDYTIQILQHQTNWFVNGSDSGMTNPKLLNIGSVPTTISVYVQDSAGCPNPGGDVTISSSASTALSVTLVGKDTACYGVPRTFTAVVTGGCPPYSYDWNPNTSTTNTNTITLSDSSMGIRVTVFDKDGQYYSDSLYIKLDTPKLVNAFANALVCNRGSATLNALVLNPSNPKDSVYWYDDPFANPQSYLYRGKPYITPSLNVSKDFYAAAYRSSSDLIGRASLAGATSGSSVQNIVGLRFSTTEPIIIQRCSLYIAGPGSSTINIALLDKYGSIVQQTGDFTPIFAANATLPTVVTLNFFVPTPGTDYKLAVIDMKGITTFNRNTGVGYPISNGKPMVITGSYSQANPSATDYFYFYNILIQKNMCVGPKRLVKAIVTEPIVPKIDTDMVYTQVCRNSPSQLSFATDTWGNRFVWYKNGAVWQDVIAGIPVDTSLKKLRSFAATLPSDTGLYQVRIYSTKFCARDTFTREVKVALYPEAKITKQPPSTLNMCITKGVSIEVEAKNAINCKWFKIFPTNSLLQSGSATTYHFGNVSMDDSGIYQFSVQDINGCIPDSSIQVKVVMHDTPQMISHPIDSVLCDGDYYVIRSKMKNVTKYQWYKDNGILPFYIRDSIIFYNAGIADTGIYNLQGSSYAGCPAVVSNYGRVSVIPSPKINAYYGDIKTCEGNRLRINASASSYSGLQWYKSDLAITGKTSDSLAFMNIGLTDAGKYYFRALSSNKCPTKASDTFQIQVVKKSTVSGAVANVTKCEGDQIQASFITTDGNLFQWYKNGSAIQSQTDTMLNLKNLSDLDTGVYFLKVTSDVVCPEAISSSFRLKIQNAPVITLQPVGDTLCQGSDLTLKVETKNAAGYTWSLGTTPLPNGLDSVFLVKNLSKSNEGKYSVTVNAISPCLPISSDIADVRVISGSTKAHLTLVSVYNAEEQCTDDEDWTYYAVRERPEEFIFAVKKNGSEFKSKVDVFLRPNLFDTKLNTTSGTTGTIMLNRYWNLKLDTGSITNPVDVKFYYDEAEITNLDKKKLDYETVNKKDSSFKFENAEMNWIKSDSIPFTNTLIGGIKGNVLGFKYKTLKDFEKKTENSIDYILLYGISNIGGGTGMYTYKANTRIISSINQSGPLSTAIYPNPNDGRFNLQVYSKDIGGLEMSVFNALGQKVYERSMKLAKRLVEIPMDLSSLSNGIYQIVLTKGEQRTSLKLQIEK